MDSTAVKCLRGLEWLCQREGAAGVTETSVALGVTKSNAHRILRTLTSLGYAKTLEDGQYEATMKAWEVGSAVLARLDVKELARPILLNLSKQTGESVHLSILDGMDVVYVDKVESTQPVRAYSRIGGRAPAYAVATGKALLAFSGSEMAASLPNKLKSFTKHTIIRRSELLKEFENIRRKGYAINQGEWREDVCGIGVPIKNEGNEVVAAIGISGPSSRLTAERLRKCAPYVVACADQISSQLGYQPNGRASSAAKKRAAAQKPSTRRRRGQLARIETGASGRRSASP